MTSQSHIGLYFQNVSKYFRTEKPSWISRSVAWVILRTRLTNIFKMFRNVSMIIVQDQIRSVYFFFIYNLDLLLIFFLFRFLLFPFVYFHLVSFCFICFFIFFVFFFFINFFYFISTKTLFDTLQEI